jgi:hypothetical protein
MLYSGASELISCLNETLYPLNNIPPSISLTQLLVTAIVFSAFVNSTVERSFYVEENNIPWCQKKAV